MYIQELSQKVHLTKKAIHFYEEKGLIHPHRNTLGYRDYSIEDLQTLLKIQQLRYFGFHISEIREILIHKNEKLFDAKKKEYDQQRYQLDTSLQFLDNFKNCIFNDEDITLFAEDLQDIADLSKITGDEDVLDFEKISFCLLVFAISLSLTTEHESIIEIIICGSFLLAYLIYRSSYMRVILYQIYQKMKK